MKFLAPLPSLFVLFASALGPVASAQTAEQIAVDVSIDQVDGLIAEHPNLLILDVRTAGEWDGGHLANAAWIDFLEDDFSDEVSRIAQDRPVLIYCAAGGRSTNAMKKMARSGFTHLYNMEGGFYAWEEGGKAVSDSKPIKIR